MIARLSPALWLSVLLAACDVPEPPAPTGGVTSEPGACGQGLVVIGSNYQASNVALLDLAGQVRSESVLSSGAGSTGLSTPLSSDVVAPTERPASGEVVLIDRFPNGVITWLDPAAGRVRAQLSVATGFLSNPHDYVEVSPRRAYVSRLAPSPAPGAEAFDGGSDVLVIDPTVPVIVDRIAFDEAPSFAARPAGMVLAGGAVWVALERLDLDYTRGLDGAVVGLDRDTGATRWRVELPGLANCTALGVSPARDRVAVSCTGVILPEEDPAVQLAHSGVVVFDATVDPPVEVGRVTVAALGAAPAPDLAPSFVSSTRLLATLLGDRDRDVPDRLVEIDVGAGGSVREVHHAAGPERFFVLGQTRCLLPCEATCYQADAGASPGVRRLVVGPDGQVTATDEVIAVASRLGLPPRTLGGF